MNWIEGLLLLLAGVFGCAPWPTTPPWPWAPRVSWILVGIVGLLILVRTSHG